MVSLLFLVLVAVTKWNFANNHTRKLCDGLCCRGSINKPLCKNIKASGQIDNETFWKRVR
jgi:hypothetical protein